MHVHFKFDQWLVKTKSAKFTRQQKMSDFPASPSKPAGWSHILERLSHTASSLWPSPTFSHALEWDSGIHTNFPTSSELAGPQWALSETQDNLWAQIPILSNNVDSLMPRRGGNNQAIWSIKFYDNNMF